MIIIRDVYAFLQQKAPFESAEEWDNAGLLVGDGQAGVTAAMIALDITPAVVRAAVDSGASLIVSHHPVIFKPLAQLTADSVPYQLAANGIAAICAHTNLDMAAGGVNDTLASVLDLWNIAVAEDGLCRIGETAEPLSGDEFAAFVAERLKTAVRVSVGNRSVRKVAVCGGAGGDYMQPLLAAYPDVDAFVTGEIKHHEWLAVGEKITVLDAGHAATEQPMVQTLAAWLTEAFPEVKWLTVKDESPYKTI